MGGGGKRNIAHSERYLILFSLHNIQLVLAGGGDSATMKLLELDYIFCPSSARNIVSLYSVHISYYIILIQNKICETSQI